MTLPRGFAREEHVVGGTRCSALVGGSGPPLVLLHGWPQTAMSWHHLLGPLASLGHTVVAPDLSGTGDSGPPARGYGKDDQAEDLRGLLRALGIGSAVRLVGHDLGGMVAFAYARLHPDEVERLVLLELAVPGLGLEQAMDVAHGGLWHFGFFLTPDVPEMLIAGHEREFFTWWYAQFAHRPLGPDTLDDVLRAYSGRQTLAAGLGHYRTLLADGATNRAWLEDGGQLRMPVLAAGGEHGIGGDLADAVRPAPPASAPSSSTGAGTSSRRRRLTRCSQRCGRSSPRQALLRFTVISKRAVLTVRAITALTTARSDLPQAQPRAETLYSPTQHHCSR